LLFLLTYVHGAIVGSRGFNNGGSGSFAGTATGTEGGLAAVQVLALGYVIMVGIPAVVVSFVGAIIAPVMVFGWCRLFRRSPPPTLSAITKMDVGTPPDAPRT
jgi:hypothetical protein